MHNKIALFLLVCLLSSPVPVNAFHSAGFSFGQLIQLQCCLLLRHHQSAMYIFFAQADHDVHRDVYRAFENDDNNSHVFHITVDKPVTVKLVSVPDMRLGFLADYNDLRGLVTDCGNQQLTLSSTGVLGGMNTEYVDETESHYRRALERPAVKVGKAVGSFGLFAGNAAQAQQAAPLEFTVHRLVDISTTNVQNSGTLPPVSPLSSIMPVYMQTGQFVSLGEFAQDVQAFINASNLNQPDASDPMLWHADRNHVVATPALFLCIDRTVVSRSSLDLIGTDWYQGIVVRQPSPVRMQLLATNNPTACLYDSQTLLAQTGSFTLIDMRRHVLNDVLTETSLDDSGNLKTINETSKSTLKAIVDIIKTITDAL